MIWKGMFPLRSKFLQTTCQFGVRNFSLSRVFRKDHYEVLGIKRDATQAEIKNAYFELSKIYHPDRIAATDENLSKFREISTAYEVLGNEQSRRLYDRGLIGEGKMVGLDESDDPIDPIVKFYKKRQQKSKLPDQLSEEDMNAWTQTFYREKRTQVFKQNELFKAKAVPRPQETMNNHMLVLVIVTLLTCIVYCAHIKEHPIRMAWLRILNENPYEE